MKTSITFFIGLSLLLLCLTSCSRKKNNFVSRNYHALTARDNIMFNGFNALEKGKKEINQNYVDNYWEILPVERMQVSEQIKLASVDKNANFNRAEEKAVKAIQKHSMNIDGKEKNPQMDEAYLLLGKARYFDERFVPALEAFNYILYKYPACNHINHAKIWREKTNIRLDNNEIAIKNLSRLLEQEKLKKQDLADAMSMLAQAFINTNQLDSALVKIGIAANTTKNHDERGRYHFIEGQLYNALGKKDSAIYAFNKVIDLHRKTPRIYYISAYIERAKNFDYENGNLDAFHKLLTKLEKDRENRPYLDKIYYQLAEYHLTTNSDSLAKVYLNQSLQKNTTDKILRAKSYSTLGNLSFDASEYKLAGAYYDSTMQNMVENSKPYRIVKRKRDNLEDVIKYEEIAQTNDSILHLVNLPKEEQLAYFTTYTNTLKEEAEKEKERLEALERNTGVVTNNSVESRMEAIKEQNKSGTTFYFYNPTTVAYGKNEFLKIWGTRKLEDNWRWSNKTSTAAVAESTTSETEPTTNEDLFNPEYYIAQIPSSQKTIDSLVKDRNYAYYQLGLIYKDNFKKYSLAENKFTTLLSFSPDEKLILPATYNLYKIYETLEEKEQAEAVKQEIITTYPNSRYATILSNPEAVSEKDESSPESKYKTLYKKFENQEYATVIETCNDYIVNFDGEPLVPKFELLKANATGRLFGFEEYKKAVQFIALNYANTNEGQAAQKIITNGFPALENKTFKDNANGTTYKALFTFKAENKEAIKAYYNTLNSVIEKNKFYYLTTSIDVYSPDITLVVVHGIPTLENGRGFSFSFKPEDRYKINRPPIAISSENYQIVQIHKNLQEYINTNL